ncbi:ephrin type-B receptor 1-like [Acropora palmata]|uniref:ephrin type-B receptor 1-like n=1 Tax=Acropora palmata TaxID=6131 RepID=UPI003D9FD33D
MNPYKWSFIVFLTTAVSEVVGDSEILVIEPPSNLQVSTWQASKEKGSGGGGWTMPTPFSRTFEVCDIKANPQNWLRSSFIQLKDAKRLEITMAYKMKGCPSQAKDSCKTYIGLYVQHSDGELVDSDPLKVKYDFVENIVAEGSPLSPDVQTPFTYHGEIVTKAQGLYIAIKDEGACIQITNITVGYNYCPEKGRNLVMFPRTIAPLNDTNLVMKIGNCSDKNAVSQETLVGVCLSSGEWNISKNAKCLCPKGYELTDGCKECPKGLFKSTISYVKCERCPQNSVPNPTRTSCTCEDGFYALTLLVPCKPLPVAPLNVSAIIVKQTSLTISWVPRDNANSTLGYSIHCFRCKSLQDKECRESCSQNVKFQPGGDVIYTTNVTALNLQSGSFYLFRVYSVNELNQQEKNTDKWNYTTVYVHTKEKTLNTPATGRPAVSGRIPKLLYIVVGISVIVFLLCFVGVLIFICRRRRRKKGYGSPVEMKDGRVSLPTRSQQLYVDPSNYGDPEDALKDFAKEQDKRWIQLDIIIGGGEFGDVYKGLLTRPDEDAIPVAVKTLKADADQRSRKDFMLEASIMGQFCDPNVIFLEGVVTKTLPLMIIIEFMSNGSLDNFLKKMDGNLTVQQLLGMARGVASGMKYLSGMNYVHRDLAARNVLVSEGMVCKVADFGLSRELEDSAYETKGGKIPVRWTALEAIDYRKFTAASDVWSYGVVLWEIMSFSERPYWEWSNFEVIDRIRGGYRLPPPLDCPKAIHQLMLNCWQFDRNKRPKFADIVKKLDVFIRSPDKLNVVAPAEPKSPKLDVSGVTSVHDWLDSIKMGQYSDLFSRAGFTQLSQFAEEEELDLSDMGINLIGHKNKIRKSIKDVKRTLNKDNAL